MKIGRAISISISVTLLFSGFASRAAIFGRDDRQEVIQNDQASKLARSTAMLISNRVYGTAHVKGLFNINFDTLQNVWDLCQDERYSQEPSNVVPCTGFLIAPDILVTAGHCMMTTPQELHDQPAAKVPFCSEFSWLFDYRVERDGSVKLKNVPASRIVGCKKVIDAKMSYDYDPVRDHYTYHQDYAVIQLDRAVTDRPVLKLASRPVQYGDPVFSIGYPLGIPAKLTTGGRVIESTDQDYFRSDLDSIGGQSGSPVFNSSNEVVGILVRGFPVDDVVDSSYEGNSCVRINRCDFSTGKCVKSDSKYRIGTEIQRISVVRALLSH